MVKGTREHTEAYEEKRQWWGKQRSLWQREHRKERIISFRRRFRFQMAGGTSGISGMWSFMTDGLFSENHEYIGPRVCKLRFISSRINRYWLKIKMRKLKWSKADRISNWVSKTGNELEITQKKKDFLYLCGIQQCHCWTMDGMNLWAFWSVIDSNK